MDMKNQKGKNVGPIRDVLNKFKYSYDGFKYCFMNETSVIFEAIGLFFIIVFGIIFKISFMEWIFAIISLLLIVEIEFINTAIEAVVDMYTTKFHPLAKAAKDCGSAATSVATFMAAIVNAIIFLPKIIALFTK